MTDGNPPAPPARGVENRDQDDDGRDGDNNEGTGARLPPPPPPAAVSWLSSLSSSSSSSSSQPSLTASSLQEAPGVSIEAKAAEMASLSDQERNALFEDLYGRKPESIEKVERLLLAVHGELRRISHVEKTAVLTRGLEEFPSPFHSSRHVLPFLQAEGFDPRRAARRMIKYWETRVRYYGEDRAFSPGTFSRPTEEDQLRIYHHSLATLNNADSTQPTKDAASAFLAKFCDQKLRDLDVEVAAMDRDFAASYFAYKEAHPHVFTTCHQLGFLQASDYNPEEAARRIVKHWYFYERLYGRRDTHGNLVYSEIILGNPLNDACFDLLIRGDAVRVMCNEDDHGRALVYCNIWALVRSGLPNADIARLVICASKIIFSIESAKCKGFVLISDHSNAYEASEEERQKAYGLHNVLFPMINGGFPVTLRAIHRWNPPPIDLYEKIDYVLSKELRVRTTHITGETREERFSKLAEYGIARSSLPDVIGGDVRRLEWMQYVDRMVTEELSRAESRQNNQ